MGANLPRRVTNPAYKVAPGLRLTSTMPMPRSGLFMPLPRELSLVAGMAYLVCCGDYPLHAAYMQVRRGRLRRFITPPSIPHGGEG